MSQQREPVPLTSWLTPASIHAAIVLGMLVRLVVYGPRHKRSFDNFKMVLPTYSQWVIGLSTWLEHYWWVVALPVLALLVVNAVILWWLGGMRRRPGWLWTWGVSGSLLSLWVAIEMGFLLPMLKLLEGLERE